MKPIPIPTIETSRLLMRPFCQADAPTIQKLAGNEKVAATTLNIPHPYEDGMAEEWMRAHDSNWKERKVLTLAITTDADGLVGAISLKLELTHRRAEMGYWIGVPFWNRGYATESAAAMLDYGFETMDLLRIEAHFIGDNLSSGRVMEKIGMSREGVLRKYMIIAGSPADIVLYAILSEEYRSERGRG